MPRNDGGTAFPAHAHEVSPGKWSDTTPGMTLRDWLAGQAMAGMLANVALCYTGMQREVASDSYKQADAMLAEREKDDG